MKSEYGKSWDEIKDDQTGLEFKQEIENNIKKLLPEANCGTHQESWFG